MREFVGCSEEHLIIKYYKQDFDNDIQHSPYALLESINTTFYLCKIFPSLALENKNCTKSEFYFIHHHFFYAQKKISRKEWKK